MGRLTLSLFLHVPPRVGHTCHRVCNGRTCRPVRDTRRTTELCVCNVTTCFAQVDRLLFWTDIPEETLGEHYVYVTIGLRHFDSLGSTDTYTAEVSSLPGRR